MKQALNEEQFAAFIGIDWADTKHDLCLQAVGCDNRESSILEHTPEAIEVWASALRRRFGGKPVAICLELNKGPLVYALGKYDFMVLFPVNPLMVAGSVKPLPPAGPKTTRAMRSCSWRFCSNIVIGSSPSTHRVRPFARWSRWSNIGGAWSVTRCA